MKDKLSSRLLQECGTENEFGKEKTPRLQQMPKFLTVRYIVETIFDNPVSRHTICRAAVSAGVLRRIGGTLIIDQNDIPKLTAQVNHEYQTQARSY